MQYSHDKYYTKKVIYEFYAFSQSEFVTNSKFSVITMSKITNTKGYQNHALAEMIKYTSPISGCKMYYKYM